MRHRRGVWTASNLAPFTVFWFVIYSIIFNIFCPPKRMFAPLKYFTSPWYVFSCGSAYPGVGGPEIDKPENPLLVLANLVKTHSNLPAKAIFRENNLSSKNPCAAKSVKIVFMENVNTNSESDSGDFFGSSG